MKPYLYDGVVLGSAVRLDAYATMLVLGGLTGLALSLLLAWRRGVPVGRSALVLVPALLAIPVGARILFVLTSPGLYSERPLDALRLELTGFSLYGGLVAAVVVAVVCARAQKVDVWPLADATAPGIALGVFLVRLGCFFDGCCFGRVTAGPFGVGFPIGSQAHAAQMLDGVAGFLGPISPVLPTQLMEGIGALVLGLVAMVASRRLASGSAFLLFAGGFSIVRLAVYPLRWIEPTFTAPTWFYPALYVSLAGLCTVAALRRRARRADTSAVGATARDGASVVGV